MLEEGGYRKGKASPCVFAHSDTGVRALVHGDDFVVVGRKSRLDELEALLTGHYEAKVQRLGWRGGRQREARFLGRVLRLTDAGATLEPDPALLEEAVHLLGIAWSCRSCYTSREGGPLPGDHGSGDPGQERGWADGT